MVSSRVILICITLFLAMVMTISSLPIADKELGTNEHTESMTNEHSKPSVDETITPTDEIKETSTIPDVVTNKLLFADEKVVPMDENIKKGEFLLFKTDNDIPVTPSTEDPRSFEINLPEDKSI